MIENTKYLRPERKNRNRTLKIIRPILQREYLVKGLQLILYPYPFLLTTLNENNNKEKNNNIGTIYLQIRCQSLSVICMEIEGSVKLLENVHNIWIAWKSAISSQTGYRTRTNIVPKLLKNAVKTVFAFCVFYNGRIYLSIYTKRNKEVLLTTNVYETIRIFLYVHHYFFTSGLTLLVLRTLKSTSRLRF